MPIGGRSLHCTLYPERGTDQRGGIQARGIRVGHAERTGPSYQERETSSPNHESS